MFSVWEYCWFGLHTIVFGGLLIVWLINKPVGRLVWAYIYVFNYGPGFLFLAPGWGDMCI